MSLKSSPDKGLQGLKHFLGFHPLAVVAAGVGYAAILSNDKGAGNAMQWGNH